MVNLSSEWVVDIISVESFTWPWAVWRQERECLSHHLILMSGTVFRAQKTLMGFLGGSGVKNVPANVGDTGSIPESGRCSGEGSSNPLQYSCLDSHGRRSLAGYSPWGHKESDTTEELSLHFTSLTNKLPLLQGSWPLFLQGKYFHNQQNTENAFQEFVESQSRDF